MLIWDRLQNHGRVTNGVGMSAVGRGKGSSVFSNSGRETKVCEKGGNEVEVGFQEARCDVVAAASSRR